MQCNKKINSMFVLCSHTLINVSYSYSINLAVGSFSFNKLQTKRALLARCMCANRKFGPAAYSFNRLFLRQLLDQSCPVFIRTAVSFKYGFPVHALTRVSKINKLMTICVHCKYTADTTYIDMEHLTILPLYTLSNTFEWRQKGFLAHWSERIFRCK